MNLTLWIVQILLAVAFAGGGAMKLAKSRDALMQDPKMGWAADFSAGQIKLIGLAELLGALGLVLPLALHVLPVLTPTAAACLAVLMGGAVAAHVRRKEAAVPAIVLGLLSVAVAVGRILVG